MKEEIEQDGRSIFFTEQHELVRKLAREFAETELTKEVLDKVEEEEVFPEEILDKMAKSRFLWNQDSETVWWTGRRRTFLCYRNGRDRKSIRCRKYLCFQPRTPFPAVRSFFPETLSRKKYLRPVVTGEKKVCFALTEPGAGSDAGGMQTTAVKDGDYYILNGRKTFITMAPLADWAVVCKDRHEHGK